MKISYKIFLNLILFMTITILLSSCEENSRTLGGFKEGYECITDRHCENGWFCNEQHLCEFECRKGYKDDNQDGICTIICEDGYQDYDNNGTCLPKCEIANLSCNGDKVCIDNSGIAVCSCQEGYQDNNGNSKCEPNCETANLSCMLANKECNDKSGVAVCVCKVGYQDNDNNGTCEKRCSADSCNSDEYCEDSSGEIKCSSKENRLASGCNYSNNGNTTILLWLFFLMFIFRIKKSYK